MGFIDKYVHSVNSGDLRDDEHHHATEALVASALADTTTFPPQRRRLGLRANGRRHVVRDSGLRPAVHLAAAPRHPGHHMLNWRYFRTQFAILAFHDPNGTLDELAQRLEDSGEALAILRARGYDGKTLTEIARKVPPASLRYS